MLLCPRCGEVLERVLDGVNACSRCEGVWLAEATISKAFGDPHWPPGPSAWWRRALECPACACDGITNEMSPVLTHGLLVDRCGDHGLWLDHGELGRLTGAPDIIELESFYQKLRPGAEIPPQIVAHRERRQAERDRRATEITAYRAKLDAEQQRAKAEKIRVERERLETLRDQASTDAAAREQELVALREQVRALESRLADARGRLLEVDRKLDALEG